MGISRDSYHKRRATGGKKAAIRKKRKYELGRPAANTKIGASRIHFVRTRGGNRKFRALRLDAGNFALASEGTVRKAHTIDMVYNAFNNELVRTKTLVKNAIVVIDSSPFRHWYESHYLLQLSKKREVKAGEEDVLAKKRCKRVLKKYVKRQKTAKIDPALEEQFNASRLLAVIASRPGQCDRADGYLLEGKELEFYLKKKIKNKNAK
ncbi:40S ribosomal protein S8-like [Sabethes cyaneus]|uniref:40S ribosomal protein S8-like n=1 Tax=Sabethes cyaneus TaxID=53552 RepID=UPI00237E877C|nr:40S ribosomal protein S8-like [Sabethes cyaneus]